MQTICAHSQNLKTYSGDYILTGYTDRDNMAYSIEGGKATYTYIEDALTKERTKHGAFTYQLNLMGWTETITGSYRNGLKHGRWTHVVRKTDYPNESNADDYLTIHAMLNAKYLEGQPDSAWTLTYTEKHRGKVWSKGKLVWGKYSPDYTVKSNAAFKVGTLVGRCSTVITDGTVKIIDNRATMDGNGFLIGEVAFLNRGEEEIHTIKNGYLSKITTRNPQTGKVLSTEDYSTDVDCITKNECEADTAQLWSVLNGRMISDELFHLTGLGGDLTVRYDAAEDQLLRNYKGAYFIRKRR